MDFYTGDSGRKDRAERVELEVRIQKKRYHSSSAAHYDGPITCKARTERAMRRVQSVRQRHLERRGQNHGSGVGVELRAATSRKPTPAIRPISRKPRAISRATPATKGATIRFAVHCMARTGCTEPRSRRPAKPALLGLSTFWRLGHRRKSLGRWR